MAYRTAHRLPPQAVPFSCPTFPLCRPCMPCPLPVPLQMSLVACVNSCHAAKSGVYNFSVLHFMPHILLMLFGFLLLLQLRLLLPLPPPLSLAPSLPLVFGNEISNVWQQMFFSFIRKSSAFIFRFVHSKRLALMRSLVVSSSPFLLHHQLLARSLTNYDNNNTHARP